MNEINIRMHYDAKVLLNRPILLQDFWKLEIAFKLKEIHTEKSQFLTLKHILHFPKDIQREWRVGESKIRVKSLYFDNFRQIKADKFIAIAI